MNKIINFFDLILAHLAKDELKIKILLDAGIITQDEFNKIKESILSNP